jgi:hypothetical protein
MSQGVDILKAASSASPLDFPFANDPQFESPPIERGFPAKYFLL